MLHCFNLVGFGFGFVGWRFAYPTYVFIKQGGLCGIEGIMLTGERIFLR